jgi:rhodanese-related sulfurtransferase
MLAATLLAACGDDDKPATAPATTPATVAGTSPAAGPSTASAVGTVTAAEFKELIATPGVVLLDVRRPDEFAAGHLAGATNIDAEAADFEARIIKLDKQARYAIYCHSGRRSALAMTKMAALGFGSVRDLGGGIAAWEQAGFPIEK